MSRSATPRRRGIQSSSWSTMTRSSISLRIAQPGQLDRGAPRSRVARLGNALVAPDCAALPWTRSEAEVATHLTPVAEVAEEHFIAQHRGKREPDAAQLRQSGGGAVLLFHNGLLLGFH